jgi:hypothetical protein
MIRLAITPAACEAIAKTLRSAASGYEDTSKRPSGNSAAAALRRLERCRPDLLDRVLAGGLSAPRRNDRSRLPQAPALTVLQP